MYNHACRSLPRLSIKILNFYRTRTATHKCRGRKLAVHVYSPGGVAAALAAATATLPVLLQLPLLL